MAFIHNLQTTVTLLIVLSILVVAHEWGHFIVARLFGIRVDDFSIGFGKRLFRLGKRGDTEYNIRMLPLGGFVKIAGMEADEEPLVRARDKVQEAVTGKKNADDPDATLLPLLAENMDEGTREAALASDPDGFNAKPLWQRSLVILAGPVMSFLLGWAVFCLMGCTIGVPTGKPLNKVGLVAPGGEGQRVGLRAGDEITAINGKPITNGQQMTDLIHGSLGKPITLIVQRGSETLTLHATPQMLTEDDGKNGKPVLFVDVVKPGALGALLGLQPGDTLEQINDTDVDSADKALTLLRQNAGKTAKVVVVRNGEPVPLQAPLPASIANGILPTLNAHPIGILKFSPAQEIRHLGLADSIRQGNDLIKQFFLTLRYLIHRGQLQQEAGGIIRMYQFTGLAVQSGATQVVSLLAQLSISLAVFNMLPIPILDGGHLLAFFVEWVRRGKKLTAQQQQAYLMTGLAIIGVLFVLIVTNDILRTIKHQLPQ